MTDTTYVPKVYIKGGGDEQVVASGGTITVESGGVIAVEAVGGLTINGVNMGAAVIADVTASAVEINMAADSSANTEIVTATNVITADECGKTFFLASATEFVSTLPAVAAGLRFSFIVTAAPAGDSYTIVTNSSANIIKGLDVNAAGTAGDSEISGGDTITFVDGVSVAGDRVDVICDGTNWFAYCFSVAAAGITITTAS